MTYPTRHVGKNGPAVTAISVGLMSLGHAYGDAGDTPTRLKYLDELYKMGITSWDDADIYGDTEDLVGEWLTANPEKRKDIFLATKCGIVMKDGAMGADTDPEYVKKACAKSLSRLQTDYIDLYYIHRVDGKTPIEHTMKALVELKNQGKIRAIGLSEVSARTLRRAHAVHPIAALQIEYSPFALEIEKPTKPGTEAIMDTCKELGITVVAYSPLGRGFLTGSIKSPEDMKNDFRGMVPTFLGEAFDKNMEIVHAIGKVTEAKKKQQPDVTQAQVVLAWLLKQWDQVIPIPGTRSISRVKENVDGVFVKLTDEEDRAIRKAAEALQKVGERYPGGMNDQLDADTPEL